MNKGLILTIFGGTGDLTFRKLLPALYNMELLGKLGEDARILIIGRRDYDSEKYRELARDWVNKFSRVKFSDTDYDRFSQRIEYFRMDFTDSTNFGGLGEYYRTHEHGEHIFYFAVAPRFFRVIAEGLASIDETHSGKIVLEKPFGEDLASARELNSLLENVFSPESIYRIDHYLGKEMVRGILAIRFTNPIFNYIWDARNVDFVQISALERVGVETRGGYYDMSGALSDMVQNHLFQILSIVAMERPPRLFGTDMHAEQLRVLSSLRAADAQPIDDTLVLGQYDGYTEEPGVKSSSKTETYAALRLFVDNDRWRNMPFYIRTGKKADRREMEVVIAFRRTDPDLPRNILVIKIQPTEGVYLQFNIKQPGNSDEITQAKMDFCQNCILEYQINTPEAYERLLDACIQGDRSWFSQWDQIEAGWSYIELLKQLAAHNQTRPYIYEPGSEGPNEAAALLGLYGHEWINI